MTEDTTGSHPTEGSLRSEDGRALFVDYGGVLTPKMSAGWRRVEERYDLPPKTVQQLVMASYESDDGDNAIARLERGELPVADFERQVAAMFAEQGHDVPSEGLIGELFADLEPSGGVWEVVDEVRGHGVPAVLVSNSWGTDDYPEERLRVTFDHVVVSGRVGVRKPARAIFELAADGVGAELARCVLIDDAPPTIEAAQEYGITGVLHRGDDEATRDAVLAALGLH